MRAGSKNCVVDILLPVGKDPAPTDNPWNEKTNEPSQLKPWRTGIWMGVKAQARTGGEASIANEVIPNPQQNFYADYLDVMEPDENGLVLDESMGLQIQGDTNHIWDIDRLDIDYEDRREVRIVCIRRRLMA